MTTIYRPRWTATLVVPDDAEGTTATEIPVRVRSARLEQNDHNHADSLRLGLDWYDAGADPRLLSGAQVKFWLGEADSQGNWDPSDDDLMFQGILTSARRCGTEEDRTVEAEFLDYTALFLRAKPFADHGVPSPDQTLADAWQRILSGFPEPELMHNLFDKALDFRSVPAPGPVIGKAVAERFRKGGKVAVNPKGSAWDVWQQVVGMCGLLTYFDRGKVVITSADELYSVTDPPRLILGENIASISEERDNNFELKGIRCSSFDPDTGRVLEALWPPADSDEAKKLGGKGKKSGPDYVTFDIPHVTDPNLLRDVAKLAYTQWSLQTFRGTLVTHEMRVESQSGVDFNLLRLRHGDSIQVTIAEEQLAALTGKTKSERTKYFIARGYSDETAGFMAKRLDDVAALRREFYVKAVNTDMETTAEGGEFKIEVSYLNKILPGGDAATA